MLLYALKGDGMQFIPLASERGVFKTMTVAFLGLTEADLKAFGGKVDNIYAAVPFVVASQDPKAKASWRGRAPRRGRTWRSPTMSRRTTIR